jgi:hypothetical protein
MASRGDILRLTSEKFAFLLEMGECELEISEPSTLLTVVAYKFTSIAVEIGFDWRDIDAACYISKPSAGRLPGGYLLLDGKRVRFHLQGLAPEVLTRFTQLPRSPRLRRELDKWATRQSDRMIIAVGIYADVLEANFAEIRSKAEAGFQAK